MLSFRDSSLTLRMSVLVMLNEVKHLRDSSMTLRMTTTTSYRRRKPIRATWWTS